MSDSGSEPSANSPQDPEFPDSVAERESPADDARPDDVAPPPRAVNATAASPLAPPERPWLGLRRGDQLFVGVLFIAGVGLLILYWARLTGWGQAPLTIERSAASRYEFKVDINRATWVEWAQLDGIGETLARKIVADREANGPFRDIDDVQRVKGIGPKSLERIRPWLELRQPAETEHAAREER